jgi:hypothetical protein
MYKNEVRVQRFNLLLTTCEYIFPEKNLRRRHTWQYATVEGHRMKNAASKFAVTLSQ